MRAIRYFFLTLFIFSLADTCYSACADMDGDGVAETCIGGGAVPEASGPTPVYDSSSSSASASSATTTAAAARTVVHKAAPSTEMMMRSAVTSAVVGSLFDAIMSTPSGPTPQEIEAQRKAEEAARIAAEKKRQAFLQSNALIKGRLKGVRTTYEKDNNTATTGELKLKTLPVNNPTPSSNAASSGDVHSNFFGSGATKATPALLREETIAVDNSGMLSKEQYTQLLRNPDLTQEERQRLYIRTVSRPHDPNDWMVDSEALVEAEHYSDPYLDVAKAAAKAGGKVLLTAGRDEVAKKMGGENLPYDELMAMPDAKKYKEKNNAEKTIQAVDFALTKAPTWTTFVDAGVNAVGAGTREAMIIYRASKDKDHRAPKKFAKEEWDKDHKCMGDWGKAVTDRIGAGEFGE